KQRELRLASNKGTRATCSSAISNRGQVCPAPEYGMMLATTVRSNLALVTSRHAMNQECFQPYFLSLLCTCSTSTKYRGVIANAGSRYSAKTVGGRPLPPRPLSLPTRWYEPNL